MGVNSEREIAARAVACPGWRHLKGMDSLEESRVLEVGTGLAEGLVLWACPVTHAMTWAHVPTFPLSEFEDELEVRAWLPDLSEPLTRLGLLHLVREAWGHEDAYSGKTHNGRRWGVRCQDFARYMGEGDTEAESLVAALEAAPAREVTP